MYENVAMMGQLMARRIAGSPGAPAQTRQPGPRGVTGPYGIMGSGPGFGRGYYPPMGPGAMLGSHPREMTGQRGQRRHGPGHRGHGMGGHGMGGARSKDHHQRMEEQLAKIANLLERLIQLQEARSRAQ